MDKILGVDIGGVIIDRVRGDGSDTSMFSKRYLETPEVKGAIAALTDLRGRRDYQVHVISKAGPSMRRKSLEWMEAHDFFTKTGIAVANIHFCYVRAEKAPICKRLGVTHFIDDKAEVLYHLENVVDRRFLFQGGTRWKGEYPMLVDRVMEVESWAEALWKLP